MKEREEIRGGKYVTVVEPDPTSSELERQDMANRLAALEAAERTRNPAYRVPDPPPGHKRVK